MDLSIETKDVGEHVVIAIKGEVDVYTAPKLREVLLSQAGEGNNHIVLDLSGVEFLDSTGLGVLVGALRRVRDAEGSMVLAATPERILKVFRITGLTKIFTVAGTVEEVTGTVAA